MLFYFACEAAGASSARHSLRPLMFRWQSLSKNSRSTCGELVEVWVRAMRVVHLAPLAGRGRMRSAAKYPGEGDYPRVRACRESPSPARKMLATSPRKRGEVKNGDTSTRIAPADDPVFQRSSDEMEKPQRTVRNGEAT